MKNSAATPESRSARATAAALFVVAYLVVQLALPAFFLFTPGYSYFSWQMFARLEDPATYNLIFPDSVLPVAKHDHLARNRADLDLSALPTHLCRLEPGAIAVERKSLVIESLTEVVEEIPCGR